MTVGTGECTMCTERKRGGNEMWGRLCPPLGQDCLPGTHLWWGPLSQFLASCPTTSRSTLTFLVSPSSWALTYSTGWDDGARKGVYDMSGVPSGIPGCARGERPQGKPLDPTTRLSESHPWIHEEVPDK